MDEFGSSFDMSQDQANAPLRTYRPFGRTDSASTDPLSATGRSESMQRAPQRLRLAGTSPKRLSRRDHGDLAPWERQEEERGAMRAQSSRIQQLQPAWQNPLQWEAVVCRIFDEGRERPTLSLGGCGLTHIGSAVGDLRHYVTIDPRRSDHTTTHMSTQPRSWARSQSSSTGDSAELARRQVQFYLFDNQLTRLPSALFQLTNLGVLSLRKNQLTQLPPAIGELRHLRELNIGGNELAYLPAEIQQLHLDTFTYVPNPFRPVPAGTVLQTRALYGHMNVSPTHHSTQPLGPSPSVRWSRAHTLATSVLDTGHGTHHGPRIHMARVLGRCEPQSRPSLAALCIQRLLSEEPLIIEEYETGCLRSLQHTLDVRVVAQLEAARRSATASWGAQVDVQAYTGAGAGLAGTKREHAEERWYTGASFHGEDAVSVDGAVSSAAPGVSTVDVDSILEESDDACKNVWFNRCPGVGAHDLRGASGMKEDTNDSDWPIDDGKGPLYVHAAEQRMEWVSHVAGMRVAKQGIEMAGDSVRGMPAEHAGLLPILWRGCSPGCLAFLEQAG